MDASNGRRSAHAIDVQGLGVRYNLRLTKKNTVRQTLATLVRRGEGDRTFWALRDVTFRLVPGESLAVIGPNGAGKSTLLQALAGIITPSEGVIDVRGHVSSLLMLGAGFDQELTGRENITLAGAFMGIPHREMAERAVRIIDFADIGQFIDAPIKVYSSGMRARLGFAIATSVDPDILLLDEVLATGDQVFRAKSMARVLELAKGAKAIVLVTHDMHWVSEFCNRAMLIEEGHVVAEGDPEEIVRIHQEHSEAFRARRAAEAAALLDGSIATAAALGMVSGRSAPSVGSRADPRGPAAH
jgi:ABC-type polysaccharide/polyol phosphate transport system ATPase subunit